MSSVKSQGYIPSSGVWTAEERSKAQEVAEHYAGIVSIPWDESEAGRAVNTVSVLIAALEDAREQVEALIGGEDTSIRGMNRQELLDSLK